MTVLGVDLGSMCLHAAVWRNGAAVPVRLRNDRDCLMSVVARKGDGFVVDIAARNQLMWAANQVVFAPGNLLGGPPVQLGDLKCSPEDLVLPLLEDVIGVVTRGNDDGIKAVGLSLPACARESARQAFENVLVKVGLTTLLVEPPTTLAAIARLAKTAKGERLAVIDVGAGKVEAAVLKTVVPGHISVIGRSFDVEMAGDWLNRKLTESVLEEAAPGKSGKILGDPMLSVLVHAACESARIALGEVRSAPIDIPFLASVLGRPNMVVRPLEQSRLDAVAAPLFAVVERLCREVIAFSDAKPGKIDEVILTGGLSGMASIRQLVAGVFGIESKQVVVVHGIVALGAALGAAARAGGHRMEIDDPFRHGHTAVAAEPVGYEVTLLDDAPEMAAFADAPEQPSAASDQGEESKNVATSSGGNPDPSVPPEAPRHPSVAPVAPAKQRETTPPPIPSPGGRVGVTPPPVPRLSVAPQADLPRSGTFTNPTTIAELLTVNLTSSQPSLRMPILMPVLLVAIGRRRTLMGSLKLTSGGNQFSIGLAGGRPSFTQREKEQMRQAFLWREGRFEILSEPPSQATLKRERESMTVLVARGMRGIIRSIDANTVLATMADKLKLAPYIDPAQLFKLSAFGFTEREQRFVEHQIDGKSSGADVANHGGVARDTVIEIFLELDLFGLLEWKQPVLRPGESLVDRLTARADIIDKSNYFEVLAVHWSSSQDDLLAAYEKMKADLGPGSRGAAAAPEAAAKILVRAEEAFNGLQNPEERIKYMFSINENIDFDSIAGIMADQASWYAWRGANTSAEEAARVRRDLVRLASMRPRPKPMK